ncbi:MAG: pyruvate dehydrogenase complex dihydrolipoamide acetyltransferase [Chitinophagaceae bacterium]|nr:pyruvate dehydrogenase complex dihydrolipoamide acetyltransferase [Chitinophagaceae bacterium]NDE77788.1 pyruvate dehydrogenase complex dihydrolipoamide acetyltransferase [Chitinophagaceae bacterium]
MAEVILMPRLSDTMTEGVIASWHKKVGDRVKKGDLLAEVETDKATMELESYKDGVLLHLGGDKGAKLQVNDLLAIIGNEGEDISSLLTKPAAATAPAATPSASPTPASTPTTQPTSTAASTMDLSKMDEVVLMPRLSDTMEEGVIAGWHKQVGDAVKKGEVLADIETDKATMELESYKNGTLLYIGAQKGEKIKVNSLLCIIGEKGKVDVDAIVAASKSSSPVTTAATSSPAPTATAQPAAASTAAPATTGGMDANGRIKASPLAKKIAKDKGVDLSLLRGSGDGGRIVKADLDNYNPSVSATAAPALNIPTYTGQTTEGFTDIPNSQMRGVIAKRLAESKFSAPHFYLKMEINMDNAISARTQLNEASPVKVSFNDFVIKAVALALRQHPAVNASWLGDKIRRYHHVHIGMAVAIEDGLIVPVVRFADNKTLPQIAAEAKELASKAKNKKLQPNEFTGNTFTISNLGMMDIDEFTAIINPPDSCILAVGRISEKIIRKGEGFAATQVMKVTLSCDHRSVDGATGAAFLQTVKKYLENPIQLFL